MVVDKLCFFSLKTKEINGNCSCTPLTCEQLIVIGNAIPGRYLLDICLLVMSDIPSLHGSEAGVFFDGHTCGNSLAAAVGNFQRL